MCLTTLQFYNSVFPDQGIKWTKVKGFWKMSISKIRMEWKILKWRLKAEGGMFVSCISIIYDPIEKKVILNSGQLNNKVKGKKIPP